MTLLRKMYERVRAPHSEIMGLHPGLVNWIRLFSLVVPTLIIAVVYAQPWIDPKWLFLDPMTAAEFSEDCCHIYFGFMSNLGVLLWTTTAAVSLFSALVIHFLSQDKDHFRFALVTGLFTGWLALDDLFLVHEVVFPTIGVPQNAVLLIYVIAAVSCLASSWRVIFRSDFLILLFAGAALALSMTVDVVFHSLDPRLVLVEDAAKFFGIFWWSVFHISTLTLYFMAVRFTLPRMPAPTPQP